MATEKQKTNLVKKHPKRQKIRLTILFSSFILLPVTLYYFSPYLPIQAGTEGIVAGSLIVFGVQFIASIFLGRVFCGWLCPVGGMQEAIAKTRNDKKRINLKTSIIKWIIFVPWLLMVITIPFLLDTRWREIDFFYQTRDHFGASLDEFNSYIIYYGIIFIVLILALVVGKRSFCHHVCWMAPFMIIGKSLASILKIPSLGLHSKKQECIKCNKCSKACPMSLPVQEMIKSNGIKHRECILCGTCADVCPKGVISYSFKSLPS